MLMLLVDSLIEIVIEEHFKTKRSSMNTEEFFQIDKKKEQQTQKINKFLSLHFKVQNSRCEIPSHFQQNSVKPVSNGRTEIF